MPRRKDGLSPKEQAFVREYLLCLNASEAYRKAYKYKGKNADVMANKVLVKAGIQAEIKKHEQRRQVEFEISEKLVIQELAAIAFGVPGKLYGKGKRGKLALREDLTEAEAKFIDIEINKGGQFGDSSRITTLAGQKVKALELLGKHIGLWKEGHAGNEDRTKAVVGRLAEYFRKRKPSSGA